jgi:serine/threonine protein kinase
MTEVPPESLGRYSIQRRLGAGGMGTVYEAVHKDTGARVAVKVLPASMAREPGFVARFEREIEALRKLESPHIVQLLDSGVDGETYYYAMEYVEGETLTDRLERDKRIGWREAIDIAVQICRALKAAHNAGVIHRDLKPSNLMLTSDGQVKLADFGVAQIFAGGKLTKTGGIIGTAEYMSPEQAQGKRATKQSDIYALGAVLYAMLTGRPPFTGKTPLDLAHKHQFGQFDSPQRIVPDLPRWLDEVVCQCLAKRPEDRYPDAYVLSLRLQELPRRSTSTEPTVPLRRRRRTLRADRPRGNWEGRSSATCCGPSSTRTTSSRPCSGCSTTHGCSSRCSCW